MPRLSVRRHGARPEGNRARPASAKCCPAGATDNSLAVAANVARVVREHDGFVVRRDGPPAVLRRRSMRAPCLFDICPAAVTGAFASCDGCLPCHHKNVGDSQMNQHRASRTVALACAALALGSASRAELRRQHRPGDPRPRLRRLRPQPSCSATNTGAASTTCRCNCRRSTRTSVVATAVVGPFSSNWDRAVELFYQIKGGCVDYGAAHAAANNHYEKPEAVYHNGRTCYPGCIRPGTRTTRCT